MENGYKDQKLGLAFDFRAKKIGAALHMFESKMLSIRENQGPKIFAGL